MPIVIYSFRFKIQISFILYLTPYPPKIDHSLKKIEPIRIERKFKFRKTEIFVNVHVRILE